MFKLYDVHTIVLHPLRALRFVFISARWHLISNPPPNKYNVNQHKATNFNYCLFSFGRQQTFNIHKNFDIEKNGSEFHQATPPQKFLQHSSASPTLATVGSPYNSSAAVSTIHSTKSTSSFQPIVIVESTTAAGVSSSCGDKHNTGKDATSSTSYSRSKHNRTKQLTAVFRRQSVGVRILYVLVSCVIVISVLTTIALLWYYLGWMYGLQAIVVAVIAVLGASGIWHWFGHWLYIAAVTAPRDAKWVLW